MSAPEPKDGFKENSSTPSQLRSGLQRLMQDQPQSWHLGARLRNYFLTGLVIVGPVTITVNANLEGKSLLVAISNTGSTLASGYRYGVGLSNCRERLNVIYGGKAALELSSDHGGVTVKVTLPELKS